MRRELQQRGSRHRPETQQPLLEWGQMLELLVAVRRRYDADLSSQWQERSVEQSRVVVPYE